MNCMNGCRSPITPVLVCLALTTGRAAANAEDRDQQALQGLRARIGAMKQVPRNLRRSLFRQIDGALREKVTVRVVQGPEGDPMYFFVRGAGRTRRDIALAASESGFVGLGLHYKRAARVHALAPVVRGPYATGGCAIEAYIGKLNPTARTAFLIDEHGERVRRGGHLVEVDAHSAREWTHGAFAVARWHPDPLPHGPKRPPARRHLLRDY